MLGGMSEHPGEIKLSEMIEALRVELAVATENGDGKALRFEVGPVELEVEVAASRRTSGNGGVEFWVLKAGAEHGREDVVTHRIKVTLQPKLADGGGVVEVAGDERPHFGGRG
jgi:hypothetical protein